jgi:hypothetical protein
MRENIEPITGSNLANLSVDSLESELKFYKGYLKGDFGGEAQKSIAKAIEVEIAIRKNHFECPKLRSNGECSDERVVGCFGAGMNCPRLEGETCLADQMDLFTSI